MPQETGPIECTDCELFYLAMLVKGESLLGVPDPFPGWLAVEIEDVLTAAEKALSERGLISVQADGSVSARPEVEPLAKAIAHFDVACFVTRADPSGENQQRRFYFKRPVLVELGAESAEQGNRYTFIPLDGHPTTLFEQVVQWWALENQPAAPGRAISVLESALRQVNAIAKDSGVDAARDHLTGAGVPAEEAQTLAETFAAARKNGALALTRRGAQGWEHGGLALLEGGNGLWRLRSFERFGETMVECIPCDAAGLRTELGRLVGQFVYSSGG